MALHNIKIIVVDGGRAGSYKEKNASGGSDNSTQDVKSSKLYQMFHAKETIQNKIESSGTNLKNSATLMGLQMTTQIAKQVVTQTANYYISDIGRKNGDSNYQDMVNRNLEIAGEVTGVLGGALSGATAGSMFGPIGTVVGAALGAASSGISTAFKYAEKNRAYQWELFQQSTSQSYNLARANYSATTGRLR